ncbi:MAG: serine/threonine protein kinase, partial [Acidobacteria bacterium]|nr:serine/threonine protein kinase [Acidobacteriota bacterium]
SPFWSPDGAWIGYSAGDKLWKTEVGSGAVPQAICTVGPTGAVGSWGGHTILFVDRPGGRPVIFRVADSGGTPVQVTTLTSHDWRHGWPHLLADGRRFLYIVATANSLDRDLLLGSLDNSKTAVLLRNVSQAELLSEDRLVYVRDGKLLAQRFDARGGTVVGEPSLIAGEVAYFYPSARAAFSAANGVVVYRTDTSTGRLTLVGRNGTTRLLDQGDPFYDVEMSPEGKRVAATLTRRATGMGDIWIYDLARDVKERFTSEPGFELAPVWAPDGRSIVYSEAPGGSLPHLVQRALASSTYRDVLPRGPFQFAGSFTHDGSAIFFDRLGGPTKEDVLRLDLATKVATPVVATNFNETGPHVSPDGRWLAFVSDASGKNEIYLLSLTGSAGERIRISPNGGENPRWRGDGRELFFLTEPGRVMSVVPNAAGDWSEVRPQEVLHASADTMAFAVTPDGQSFVLMEHAQGESDSFFHVALLGR